MQVWWRSSLVHIYQTTWCDSRINEHIGVRFSHFRVLSCLSWFLCVEIEVLVHAIQRFFSPPVTSKDIAEAGHKGSLLELMKPMGMSWKVASSMQIVGGYLNLQVWFGPRWLQGYVLSNDLSILGFWQALPFSSYSIVETFPTVTSNIVS